MRIGRPAGALRFRFRSLSIAWPRGVAVRLGFCAAVRAWNSCLCPCCAVVPFQFPGLEIFPVVVVVVIVVRLPLRRLGLAARVCCFDDRFVGGRFAARLGAVRVPALLAIDRRRRVRGCARVGAVPAARWRWCSCWSPSVVCFVFENFVRLCAPSSLCPSVRLCVSPLKKFGRPASSSLSFSSSLGSCAFASSACSPCSPPSAFPARAPRLSCSKNDSILKLKSRSPVRCCSSSVPCRPSPLPLLSLLSSPFHFFCLFAAGAFLSMEIFF